MLDKVYITVENWSDTLLCDIRWESGSVINARPQQSAVHPSAHTRTVCTVKTLAVAMIDPALGT